MTSTQKNSGAHLGAPAQRTQASRKGKRAWRKHVDIDAVEQRLDDRRAEERALGAPVHAQPDAALFAIDTKGDDGVRKAIPRQLKSLAILAERSAVPAVGQKRKAASVPRAEKDRLMRAAGRTRRGPLRSHVDGTELGKGSALLEPTEAVKHSGTYDVWEMDVDEDDKDNGFGVSEMVKPKPVKPPTHTHPSALIAAPAVPTPHAGASYNPPVDAHQELLLEAYEVSSRCSRIKRS
ncbi:ribosome biogenesis protein Nop53/GLTSCR2 [Schizophyllum amplum]|uniref:Ribosome biogenesis protein NOP53 n=1 Tax=Schizophyllum amplum TaxID=97359 RepID=A0A550CQU6_9AGAR|nr:ribosome biogenesis protein Nop53/GLTSCR2 [Auriculariopsis ampla]